ncbi:uncharacterized protein LOC125756812 [Rhipicephalus sanguineus]|uniref:uncharacterized protein LOC125756812 n=1 Tax=Rhipicephalus sanguineus TaxID=34632 RepID=UPI0020C230E7|nr:uncharacterized protein LOC125756812 [Rhipicephalus sanguineus]
MQYAALWFCATFSSTVVLEGAAHGSGVRKCPDGGKCVLGTSCMNISPGLDSYGCCPYDRGVPCLYKSDTGSSSEKHGCCPRGHRCQQGACSYDEGGVTLSYAPAALLPPLRRSLRSSSCSPKETVSAKDHTTCPCWQQLLPHARVPGGNVLLLPVEYGQVCCPDGSCCAAGYRCEPRWGICTPTLAGSALNEGAKGEASPR